MKGHLCGDDTCLCPKCGKAMYYAERSNEHACVDPQCGWREDLNTYVRWSDAVEFRRKLEVEFVLSQQSLKSTH